MNDEGVRGYARPGRPSMAYVIVLIVALVAGALVYWLTLRAGGAEPVTASTEGGAGFLPEVPVEEGG